MAHTSMRHSATQNWVTQSALGALYVALTGKVAFTSVFNHVHLFKTSSCLTQFCARRRGAA
jgi:hypothetical protein